VPALRLLVVLGVVALAIGLFVVLSPGEDEAAPPDAGPVAAEPEPAEEPAEPEEVPAEEPVEEPAPEPEAEAPTTITVVVRGGLPEGGIQRPTVERGADVRLVVRSDTPDEVHVHGYDIERPVGPGAPAQLRFRADVPGRFEVELHERHTLIAEIEVRP
jgi:hypothetical protein